MTTSRANVPIIPVVFRVYRPRTVAGQHDPGGDVAALFPTIPGDSSGHKCDGYDYRDGNFSADYASMIEITRPAKPSEYAALLRKIKTPNWFAPRDPTEMQYKVEVFDRASREMHAACLAEARGKTIRTHYAPAAWTGGGGGANMVASM